MDFATAVRTCITKYAAFDGRASRPEFWWWVLFWWLVSAATGIVDSAIGMTINLVWWGNDTEFDLFQSIAQLIMLLPSAAVATRRFRDAGRSYWNFLWLLLPVVGWVVLAFKFSAPSIPSTDTYTI